MCLRPACQRGGDTFLLGFAKTIHFRFDASEPYNDPEEIVMGLSDQPFEVMCPDCGAMLKVDPVTRAIIAHKSAPKKKMFEDFGEAAKALREADARRDSIFQQSVEAQKNKEDVLAKKFAEAVKKAKETPLGDRPLRDFDLD
jgi:hypothetical protein